MQSMRLGDDACLSVGIIDQLVSFLGILFALLFALLFARALLGVVLLFA